MKILILEDKDERLKQFNDNLCSEDNQLMMVKEAVYAIDYLSNEKWDVLFLDHDLGGQINVSSENENTGSEVARFLKQHPFLIPNLVILHSLNMIGCKYMKGLLPDSVIIPFAWTKLTLDDIQPNMFPLFKQLADSQNQQIEYGKL